MSIKDLLTAIHKNESLKLCKISPKYRDSERNKIAEHTEAFLKAGNKITVLPNNFSTQNNKAA